MSNARRHRRAVTATKMRQALAAAQAEAPAILFGAGSGDGFQMQPITVGPALYFVAVPPAGASEALLLAYSARATASVRGRCPACGARRHLSGGHHRVLDGHFAHNTDCAASDRGLNELLVQEGFR